MLKSTYITNKSTDITTLCLKTQRLAVPSSLGIKLCLSLCSWIQFGMVGHPHEQGYYTMQCVSPNVVVYLGNSDAEMGWLAVIALLSSVLPHNALKGKFVHDLPLLQGSKKKATI